MVEEEEERREGGSIVRTARRVSSSVSLDGEEEEEEGEEEAIVTATTESATASSAWEGSKNMLLPMLITSNVIGGLAVVGFVFDVFKVGFGGLVGVEGGYNGTAASQSSLKRGSSSFSKPFTGAGRWVDRRARWVVRERRGRG